MYGYDDNDNDNHDEDDNVDNDSDCDKADKNTDNNDAIEWMNEWMMTTHDIGKHLPEMDGGEA